MILLLAWLLVMLLSVPMLTLAAECLAALLPGGRLHASGFGPPFLVLMPAHDEAAGIGAAIASVQAQLRRCDRFLVVADNCSDATAALARQSGAAVIERFDGERRGKSYALAFARDHLAADKPPAVVVIVDADCHPAPEALQRLAAVTARRGTAMQGLYVLEAPQGASVGVRISTFAFLVKNFVRQRGLRRLGGPALLQGTGMAFPWQLFATAPLQSASLVEDMELGLSLVLSGEDVGFDERALFVSPASSPGATATQRTRWEHGQIATAAAFFGRLLAASLWGRAALLVLALDIAVPPLSLLAAAILLALAVLAPLAFWSGPAPLITLSALTALLAVLLMLCWLRWGRTLLPPGSLLRLPAYFLWKLPIYGRFLTQRQRAWVRTSRRS